MCMHHGRSVFRAIFENGSCKETVPLWVYSFSRLGSEDDFRILASSIYSVTCVWQRARHGCSAAQSRATGHLTSEVPSSMASSALQPGKCYNLRVWITSVPQTSSRDSCKKEGAFLTSFRKQPAILSAGHSKVGREENKMWMGGVKGIWGLQLHWPQPSVRFWFSSWGQEGGRTWKGHQAEVYMNGKGVYFLLWHSVQQQNKKKNKKTRMNA